MGNWGKFLGTQVQHRLVRLVKTGRLQGLPPLPLGVHLGTAWESAPGAWVLPHVFGMIEGNRPQVLTDAQWEVLTPLIEACRPPHKTEHHDLRRTIEAIIWRHDSGAKVARNNGRVV